MQVPSLKSVSESVSLTLIPLSSLLELEDVEELLDPLLLGGICGTN
jgi:hypothetical protein